MKGEEDKNIQKLREEFNQKSEQIEHHPKTSHGEKHFPNRYINSHSINNDKNTKSYIKTLSANKYKQNIKSNSFFDNHKFEINKNHPGYLYYIEILKTAKFNKKRTNTGKTYNRKYKLEPILKRKNKNNYINNGYNLYNEQFNKGTRNKAGKQVYLNNKNNKEYPYNPFLRNKIWNKNNFRNEKKSMSNGLPQLYNTNIKDDYIFKIFNKEKEINTNNNTFSKKNNIYQNNFVSIKNHKKYNNKCIKIISNYKNNKENNNNILNQKEKANDINDNTLNNKKNKEIEINKEEKNDDEINMEDFDEEQDKLFNTNQKNFFKARKDIIEEPEYLEEDNENIGNV